MNDIKDIGNNIIQLMFPYTFFSDTELIVQQLPPYYHYNESYLNKCAIATGEYDISKWFRSLSLALIPHSNEDQIDIKQGDVLYYIRFNTSKKINLKKFYPSEDLINISNNIKLSTHADKSFKFKPLSLYYNTFKKSKIKNKIIKEIKNNLL